MDSMEYGYCCEQKPKAKKNNCFRLIAEILGVLFALTIGIIGAELASTILAAIAAIIVLAIILGILFVLTIILIICKNRKNNRPC